MSIIPLRVHSYWSLLDGVPSIAQIVAHARQQQLPALALTDCNALYGVIDFVQQCRAVDIQPLIGVDFTLRAQRSVRLLARSLTGYASLCRLVTGLQASADREAVLARGLSLADIAAHAADVVALAEASVAAELIEVLGRDQVFIELSIRHPAEVPVAQAAHAQAQQWGVRTVAAPDVRYLAADDAGRYRVLSAMRRGQLLSATTDPGEFHFLDQRELHALYADFPDALAHTQTVAQLCHFDFPLGQLRFPAFGVDSGQTPRQLLEAAAWQGAAQRYAALTPEVEARLNKEIYVIDTLGFDTYFLIVADIVRFARERGVPVSPRGSASSSVVAYCLGIHDVDPLAHNLYFERFLSLERRDAPDIDLDLCSHRRDEVIDYVYRTYGADHVAMVCTYATLQPRSALREVCKVYGLPEARIGELADQLPHFWHPGMRAAAHDAQTQLLEALRDPREHEAVLMSQTLTGTPHHLSIHPGGIVISPGPITDLVPLQHATKGLLITQFDLTGIEKLGLIKIDLLGISALTVVADCVELIRAREPDFALDQLPLNDAATAQTLAAARTIGCFQIESPGMRFTLRELHTTTVNDLIAALSLYRPGPLKGGLKDAFVRRHLGQEAATYLHPALEPILQETHGVILYQEQVLRIAHEVGGFTLGQADVLRRAMSKFRSAREMDRLRAQFVAGAQAASGLPAASAEQIWEMMAAFAGYGFPKAHAAGYAAVAYRMAYLKTHYPAQYFAARLAVWGGYYSPRMYMCEARHLGLHVRPPHINHSREAFTLDPVDGRTLWMGLGQVRDLTHSTIQHIGAQQPFTSLDDFLIRAQPLYVEAINLVKAGALAGYGGQFDLLERLQHTRWHGRHSAQLPLLPPIDPVSTSTVDRAQQAAWEREVLGEWVGVHPLELVTQPAGLVSSDALAAHLDRVVALAGVRLAAHRFRSSAAAGQAEAMLLVDMEDLAGGYQVLWNGAALKENRALLSLRDPVVVRGRVRRDRQGRVLIVGRAIEPLPAVN